ncbi:hypothetical protein AOLI_G00311180 [Acnodon oligacanthus]
MKHLEEEILKLSSCGTEAAGTNAAGDLERNKLLLSNLLEERGRGALVHARYMQFNDMDAPTSFFFGLEKQHREKKALNCLRLLDGTETSDKQEICGYALSFFENLYSAEPCDQAATDFFLWDLPCLSEEDRSEIEHTVSFNELTVSVQEQSEGKAPGVLHSHLVATGYTKLGHLTSSGLVTMSERTGIRSGCLLDQVMAEVQRSLPGDYLVFQKDPSVIPVEGRLSGWRTALSPEEQKQVRDYSAGVVGPSEHNPFADIRITLDLQDCEGPLLECEGESVMSYGTVSGKLLYRACVKVLNKKRRRSRSDTPWRDVFNLSDDVKPEWTALYKTPLTKKVADLQWRMLHVCSLVREVWWGVWGSGLQGVRFAGSMAPQNTRLYESVSHRHGVKVECCLLAGSAIGYNNVVSASHVNSAVVMFLSTVDKANELVQSGLVINDQFMSALPLGTLSKKIFLSNVALFISDELIAQGLSQFGKLVSPVKKIPRGCKSHLVKHLVSSRRLVYMVLRDGEDELDLVLKFRVEGFEYIVRV